MLIRRYKRFLADIRLHDEDAPVTIHCPNTGAMTRCAEPGWAIWYSTSDNPRRKYRHTLELVRDDEGQLIAVNSARANAVVAEALAEGLLPSISTGDTPVRREVAIPGERGRFDLVAGDVYVEVKAVTLNLAGTGAFPDSVSVRATRHVNALARLARSGRRTALVFCVLHTGIRTVRPAHEVDPAYARTLRLAAASGLDLVALRCRISPLGIRAIDTLPVRLA